MENEIDLTLPCVLEPSVCLGDIRPEIQLLIDRGSVEISEVAHLNCNKVESDALIASLTNDSMARRLDRTLANIKIPPPTTSEYNANLWALFDITKLAQKRLERKEDGSVHTPYDARIAEQLTTALAPFGSPTRPGITYAGAWHVMATDAVRRLTEI